MARLLLVAALLLAACSVADGEAHSAIELPDIDGAGMRELLAGLERPAVVNVWASWCLPCRSEAPLLAAAHRRYGEEIAFIGVDVQDDRASARAFIVEFGLDFDHYFDPVGAVPAELGGFGVPITYFVAAGGEIMHIHSGIIDQQTLALRIDELTR